ncbi:MAG: maleylpyruvate isomerase family mycothiol-dependent enzyme [Acidimicrobiia bacterium]
MQDRELVNAQEEVWDSIIELCRDLDAPQWQTMTDCPGWSVQDNVAHLIAIESMLLGRPTPDHVAPDAPHVKNDVGKFNEVWVDFYRSRTGPEVLDEFRTVTDERRAILRGYSEADFAAESWTPMGPGTVRDLLPFRIFDAWVHEQDMRRALGRPGSLEDAGAGIAMDRIAGAVGYVVGKKAGAPDGTTVVLQVRGARGRVMAVEVVGGRGNQLTEPPPDPTVRITTDVETFIALGCGRWAAEQAIDDGRVTFAGDADLGGAIVAALNVLF